jgi:hypothetical protein
VVYQQAAHAAANGKIANKKPALGGFLLSSKLERLML